MPGTLPSGITWVLLAGIRGLMPVLMNIELVELEPALLECIVQVGFGILDHGCNCIILTANPGMNPILFQADF